MRKHPGCQQLPFTLKHRLTSTKLACDQGQLAASRGRRRETPGDPRPSACASMTHPGYFGDARHDRTIGVRPLPRAAPENVRKLLVGDGEQPKNVCVVSGRRSRATRQQEHAPSRTDTGQPGSTSPAGAEQTCDARRSEQCQRKRECQAARAEDGAERRQAPIQHPSTWPRQGPAPPHRSAGGRPTPVGMASSS
jgi:hypothetical protein